MTHAAITATILLITLTAHLLHHRLTMRPISYVEAIVVLVLWLPGLLTLPEHVWVGVHVLLTWTLVLGSISLMRPSARPRRALA